MTVQEGTTDQLVERCTQGEIDLAVAALPLTAGTLQIEELFEEELFLVMPPDHPLGKKRRILMEDLKPFPFVLLDEAHCLSEHIVTFCRHRSFQPVSMERTSQLATVQELVSLNHGVSMIPAMARKLDDSGRRRYRSLSAPRPTRRLAMIWNPNRFESHLLKAFKKNLFDYSMKGGRR